MTDEQEGGRKPTLGFAAISAALPPLDWTLAHLTGLWVRSGEMVSCPLPGHDDSTPSFNLWDDDEDGVPQRFGCFGCDRNGDVIGLIAEFEGLTNTEAIRRAADLSALEAAEDYQRERSPKKKRENTRDLAEVYQGLVEGMTQRDFEHFVRFMDSKEMSGEEMERYAMDEWGWVASGNMVATPHRALGNEITGIKYRSTDRKWNEPGSQFMYLYGAWRDKHRKHVLICEGETDTVWAAFSLRDEDIDVLGLPSGASQQIRPEWMEVLAEREITVAFDADEAGMKAAQKWCATFPNTTVARLPEGEDVLSSRVPAGELVDRSKVPVRGSGMVTIDRGVFCKHTKDGDVPVADFSFNPARELITEEGPAWEGKISGDRREVLVRAADLANTSTMTKWANRHGRSWTGGSPVVQGVFNYLASRSAFLPLEMATTKAGKIGRSFVGPGFCIGTDRVRYIPPALGDAKLETRLNIEEGAWDSESLVALEQMNDPATMAIVLGWLTATLLRGSRAPAPPLFVSGESGAGKTNLLSTTLRCLGFATETNLTTTTPFGVDCMVSSCVGFPVWFDEYRGGARVDSMERLRQLLRDAYYGQPSMKGGMKQQATELSEVTTWAGIIVSGEMGSGETSHRDRIVMLDLDTDKRNREPFQFLQDKRRTRGLGHDLLTFLADRSDTLFRVTPQGPEELPDRFRDTMGFVMAGWQAWREFRWHAGVHDTPTPPNLNMLMKERKDAVDPWLEAIRVCEGVTTRGDIPIVEQQGDDLVIIPSEVIVEARRVGIELPARANELVAWLRRRYTVEDTRAGFNGNRRAKRVRGMKL